MIITLKTLQQKTFRIEVEETESVRTFKEKIEAHNAEFPANCQKLFYAGKILSDDTKIGEYDIDEKKFVVVMVTKPQVSQDVNVHKASTSQANPAHSKTEASKETVQPPSGDGEPSPATEAKTQTAAKKSKNSILPSVSAEGLDISAVKSTLVLGDDYGNNNPDKAVEYLISGVRDKLPSENEPYQKSSPTHVGGIQSVNSISIPPENDIAVPEFKFERIPNSGKVTYMAANGSYIITASEATDEKLKVWDTNALECKYIINEHEIPITGIKLEQVSRDKALVPLLTSVTVDGTISEIVVPKGAKFQEIVTYHLITCMDILGNYLVFGNSNGELEIYSRHSSQLFLKTSAHPKSIDDLSVTGEKISTACFPSDLKVWQLGFDKLNLIFNLDQSYGIFFTCFDYFYYKCRFFPTIEQVNIFKFTNTVVVGNAREQKLDFFDVRNNLNQSITLNESDGGVTAINATANLTLASTKTGNNIFNLYGIRSCDFTILFYVQCNSVVTKIIEFSTNNYAVAGDELSILRLDDNERILIHNLEFLDWSTEKMFVPRYRILDTNTVGSVQTDGNFIVVSEPVPLRVFSRSSKANVLKVWNVSGEISNQKIVNRYGVYTVWKSMIYTVDGDIVTEVDISDGAEKREIVTHNVISCVELMEQFIITGNFDGSLEVFEIRTGELCTRKSAHIKAIDALSVQAHHGSKKVFSAVYKSPSEIKVWSLQFDGLILLKCIHQTKKLDFSSFTTFYSPFLQFLNSKINFGEGVIVNDTHGPLLHACDIHTDNKYSEEMYGKVTALHCNDIYVSAATLDEEEKVYIHVYNLIGMDCLYSCQCSEFDIISTVIILDKLRVICGGTGLAILEVQEFESSSLGHNDLPRDPADAAGGGAAGEDAPSRNHPAGGQGGKRSPTHPGTEGGQQEDTKGPASKKPRLDNMDDWMASDVALIEDPEVYGNLTQTAKQLTSYTFEVCDSLLNIGPCGKIVMGEPAFLSEEFSGSPDQDLELVTTSGYGKNGALSVLQRSVLPQVVTTFELPGCVDMWTVIGQISESENSEEKVSDMQDKEDSSEETQSKPALPLKNSHAFLILSRTDSSMILQTGQEINELDHSGFSTQAPTIFAGNMDNNCFIVQVSQIGMRLLQGSAQVQHIPLDVGSPIVWASVADPYLIIMSAEGQVIQLMLKTDDFGGGPRLQVTRPQVKSRVSSLCAYKDISGIFNTKSRQGPEELVTVTNHNAPTLNMADVMQMNHEMSNPWKSMLLNF